MTIITPARDRQHHWKFVGCAIVTGMKVSDVTLSIFGSGGDGAVAAGDIVAMACAGAGLHVIKTEAYGPQIRGGESSCTVRISVTPITALADAIDALVVFNWIDYARFRDEMTLSSDCVVYYDAKDAPPENLVGSATLIPIAFSEIAPKARNVVGIGLLASLFGLPADGIRAGIRHRFVKKSAAVIAANLEAFERGLGLDSETVSPKLSYTPGESRLLLSGNEATALGAIHAGCSFFAGYPITPSSEILHFLCEWLPKLGGTCLQTEDELSALGAVIGRGRQRLHPA